MLKLIPGTLHVNPLNDYGAVEIGEHRFFQLLPGKPEKLVERCAAAASAAEHRYTCAPPLLLTRGGRKP
jgi:hypothetical protein